MGALTETAFLRTFDYRHLDIATGSTVYVRRGFKPYHVLAAPMARYNEFSRGGYVTLFDDELEFELMSGWDTPEEAEAEARKLRQLSLDQGPLAELRTVVWDPKAGKRLKDFYY